MTIRRLPDILVNRIAAGEVVERPAAAAKELVENAIDAGATRIDVAIRDGGRSFLLVSDNGCGMDAADLALAIERHATSKLQDDDLTHIMSLGFRGEALPSIAAVSRMSIATRRRGDKTGWNILIEGGKAGEVMPSGHPQGTRVEVRDLFFATPARLKFLKSVRTESLHVRDTIERLAMAYPDIGFTFTDDDRTVLRLDPGPDAGPESRLLRLSALMGREFRDAAIPVFVEREDARLSGHIGLPTLNKPTGQNIFLFVNGRPVRDRLLIGALRAGYADVLAHDRHPMAALFLDLPAEDVDVNVHPAKTEVRFRDSNGIRSLLVSGIRHTLADAGHRTAPSLSNDVLSAFRPQSGIPEEARHFPSASGMAAPMRAQAAFAPLQGQLPPQARTETPQNPETLADHPLGAAVAQVHNTFIVSQTADGLVITDQHAAHERLTYERIKAALDAGGVARQTLLLPEVVDMPEADAQRIADRTDELARLGLVIEPFGPASVLVREIPALLGQSDIQGLVRDIADELSEAPQESLLKGRLMAICSRMSCHGSVRAGRKLAIPEMNALLRQMEDAAFSGQCNHGRPTHIALKLSDIERLFGRRK